MVSKKSAFVGPTFGHRRRPFVNQILGGLFCGRFRAGFVTEIQTLSLKYISDFAIGKYIYGYGKFFFLEQKAPRAVYQGKLLPPPPPTLTTKNPSRADYSLSRFPLNSL